MSKIFKISGNFQQGGEWAEPDPAFTGEIVTDENETLFVGYCDELYGIGDLPEAIRARYLTGAFATNRIGECGATFYKLSNCVEAEPLIYLIPSVETGTGTWAALSPFGDFAPMGDAKITLGEVPYSQEEEAAIRDRFDEVDDLMPHNAEMLSRISCCADMVRNVNAP